MNTVDKITTQGKHLIHPINGWTTQCRDWRHNSNITIEILNKTSWYVIHFTTNTISQKNLNKKNFKWDLHEVFKNVFFNFRNLSFFGPIIQPWSQVWTEYRDRPMKITNFIREFKCCSSGYQCIDDVSLSASGRAVQRRTTQLYTYNHISRLSTPSNNNNNNNNLTSKAPVCAKRKTSVALANRTSRWG